MNIKLKMEQANAELSLEAKRNEMAEKRAEDLLSTYLKAKNMRVFIYLSEVSYSMIFIYLNEFYFLKTDIAENVFHMVRFRCRGAFKNRQSKRSR